MSIDLRQMADAVIQSVREFVGKAETALGSRIDALDRKIAEIPTAKAGKDGLDGKDGHDGRNGEDGKSVSIDDVAPILEGFFARWALDFERRATDTMHKSIDRIPVPKDGVDGKDGRNGEDGRNGVDGSDGVDGEDGRDGRDGIDGKSVTLDDLSSTLEILVSKWALEFERRATDSLQKAVDRMPAPKDGEDGKNGADGLGFDDMDVQFDGERCISIVFAKGDITKKFDLSVPAVIDRGIYREGTEYSRGDGVTWAGSYWIAQDKTAAKPDSGDGWRLAVKRGRDGKDGRNGIDLTAPVKV
jgi:integrin beta 3